MRVNDIITESQSPQMEAVSTMKELRTLAADKYGITIDSSGTNASNILPVVRVTGTWYGGRFIPRGGSRGETKRSAEGGIVLSPEKRALGLIIEIGRRLEGYIKAGRQVRITKDKNGAWDGKFHTTLQDQTIDTVRANLVSVARESSPPQVFWWVSPTANQVGTATLRFLLLFKPKKNVATTPAEKYARVSANDIMLEYMVTLPSADIRAWLKKFAQIDPEPLPGKTQPLKKALAADIFAELHPDDTLKRSLGSSAPEFYHVDLSMGRAISTALVLDPAKTATILTKHLGAPKTK